ncbi:hypothetical protein [Gordoniibacillus kamchatkensis]|uniref:hypothetical protein n=1 Tax=Gordoniibacillus kamchatkensis TaxID=1590651 RepID=UPI001E34E500|nr:hypothetical protein [Paenibacillus sp. VKM B-2647]
MAKGFAGRAQGARPVLVNGAVGVVVAPRGQLLFILELKIVDGKITEIEMIAEQDRIRQLDLAEMKD